MPDAIERGGGSELVGPLSDFHATEDVARQRRMRALIAQGMLPSEAATTVALSPAPMGISALVEAAQALDTAGGVALVTDALAANGVVPVWDRLCRPALGLT
ncbi:MAG TPA: hypothetical protein VL652_43075 [Kutzneria sp.]|nr:hypothetical protein [Kutzneria sp.]